MSLTPSQRQAALAYLATVSDDMLASLTWQVVGYNDDISADVAEVAAVHCDNVVAHSMLHYDAPNAEHQANARSNVKSYGNRARTLRALHAELHIEVNAEMVEVKS